MSTDRRFLVTRAGLIVYIREVEPGSCSFSFSRSEAWDHAKRQAKAAKRSQDPKRRSAATHVVYTGLDMSRSLLDVAQFLPRDENVQANMPVTVEPPAVATPEPTPNMVGVLTA